MGVWLQLSSLVCMATLSHAAIVFDERGCPLQEYIVYSPFKNWSYFWPSGNRQNCWGTAMCLLDAADEARKQVHHYPPPRALRPQANKFFSNFLQLPWSWA